jgi:hypothetical protein
MHVGSCLYNKIVKTKFKMKIILLSLIILIFLCF